MDRNMMNFNDDDDDGDDDDGDDESDDDNKCISRLSILIFVYVNNTNV